VEGLTAKLVGTGAVIVSVVELLVDPEAAVMLVVPTATAVTSPWLPAALLMVAAAGFEELQVS